MFECEFGARHLARTIPSSDPTSFAAAESSSTSSSSLLLWSDILCGLSVLTTDPSQDEKVAVTFFDVIDINRDGHITLAELERYFTAVFCVVYVIHGIMMDTPAGIHSSRMNLMMPISPFMANAPLMESMEPSALAHLTALATMDEADLDRDGFISFTEFQR